MKRRNMEPSMLTFRRFSFGEYQCIYQSSSLDPYIDQSDLKSFSAAFLCMPNPALEHIYQYFLMERSLSTFFFFSDGTFISVRLKGNVIKESDSALFNIMVSPVPNVDASLSGWILDMETQRFYSNLYNTKPQYHGDSDFISMLMRHYKGESREAFEQFITSMDQKTLPVDASKKLQLVKTPIENGRFYFFVELKDKRLESQPQFIPLKSEYFHQIGPRTLFYDFGSDQSKISLSGDTEEILGYHSKELEEFTVDRWHALIHPEDVGKRKTIDKREPSKPTGAWYRIRHGQGHYVFVYEAIYPYLDAVTGQERIFGKIRLASKWEYRQGEDVKIKHTFKELADCMPDLVYLYSENAKGEVEVRFLSGDTEEILGVDAGYFKKNVREIIDSFYSVDIPQEGRLLSNTKSSEASTMVFQVMLPNKEIRWLYSKSYPLREGDDAQIRLRNIVDMSSHRSIEEEAMGVQDQSTAGFDYIPLVIFQYNSQGTILKANRTLFQKTQITDRSKYIGRSIHEIYKDSTIYDTLLQGINKGFARYEGPFISFLNNSKYYVGLTVRKLENEDIYQAAFEDISEKDFVQRVLNEVATISAHFNDAEFFNQLVKLLSQKLNFTFCMVGEYVSQSNSIRSIAVAKSGELIDNFSYSLLNTPCYHAINGTEDDNVVIVPNQVAKKYPKDKFLQDEQLVSYCSTGIKDKSGKKLGILVLADRSPILNQNILINIISILGDRAGAELQRMRYEKELIASQQLYQSIAENFPKGTIDVLDRDLKYIYTEGSEYRNLQINPKHLIGAFHLAKYEADVAAHAKAHLEEVFGGKTVTYEISYNGENYKKIGVPLRNEEGEVTRALLVTQNISAYKIAEVEREKLIRDLSSHNEELQHFAYIVSHNLRAPIVNITSLLDLIDADNLSDEENKVLFDSLKDSTSILNTTLMDLIEVVSIKKKKLIKIDRINFDSIVNNIEKSLFRQLKDAKAKIHRDFEAAEINYVYSHLENFLLNFMTNAIKYSHPDRIPEIIIKTREEGDKCRITFTDNGIGIDLEKYGDRIFGLYQRFHNHVEGKGLGLYLIKEQIRSLDGEISVKSSEGEGTTFSVLLKNLPLP
ncbi:ATP-binding protein [Echinicola soli]|nr:ATP-binding protein [Echinicola soli]